MKALIAALCATLLFLPLTSCQAAKDYAATVERAAAERDAAIAELREGYQQALQVLRDQVSSGEISTEAYLEATSAANASLLLAIQETNQEFAASMTALLSEAQTQATGFLSGLPSTGSTAIDAILAVISGLGLLKVGVDRAAHQVNSQRDAAREIRGEPTGINRQA